MITRFLQLIKTVWLKIRYGSRVEICRPLTLSLGAKCKVKGKNGKLIFEGNANSYGNIALSAINGKLTVGASTFFNRNCIIVCRESITIGKQCSFGPNVCVYDHDHVFDEDGVRAEEYKVGSVVIGDNCWIGAGAIILRGTHIGEGCVVGAGTVVKGNIPAHSLVTAGRDLSVKPICTHK